MKIKNIIKSKKRFFSLILAAAALTIVSTQVLAAVLPYDPFDRYGKQLPWSYLHIYRLTKTPNSHYAGEHHYYAQDFAYVDGETFGQPVLVISDGIVHTVQDDFYNPTGWGRYVIIDHGNGYYTQYNHLSFIALNQSDIGKTIRQGQEIGLMGEAPEDHTTGPNLEMIMFRGSPTLRNSVKATSDHRDFLGHYAVPGGGWVNSVNNFDKPVGTWFLSVNALRPDDPDNPWDPDVIDPLERYLENYGYLFPSGMIAEPINTATGGFVHRNIDMEINSDEGLDLVFERFYNSNSDYIGANGEGWTNSFSYEVSTHDDPNGEAPLYSVKMADGRGEIFKETDDDPKSYTSTFTNKTPFSLAKLERLAQADNYKFKYTDTAKNVYIFNSDRDMSTSPSKATPKWGKVEKITDVNGRSLNFEYDNAGKLIKVTDNLGKYINLNYNKNSRLASIMDSSGRLVTYHYNFDGKLQSVQKLNGSSWNYQYDDQGQITKIVDGSGKLFVENTYDQENRVIAQKDGQQGITTLVYEKEKNLLGQETGNFITKTTDNNGNIITHKHNSLLYLTEETQPNEDKEKYQYNYNGRVIKYTSAKTQETRYERDSQGNITNEYQPEGYEKHYTYNSNNQPVTISDSSGTITYTYNSLGKITQRIDQKGNATRYTYDANGFLASTIDPNGNTTVYTHSVAGLLLEERDLANGTKLEHTYDAFGNKLTTKDASGNITRFSYNTFGNLTRIEDPRGLVQSFEYDGNGNLRKEIDEGGFVTLYESDANENITKITYHDGSSEGFVFDPNNNKIRSKDRNDNLTRYSYDVKNRLVAQESIDSSGNVITSTSFEYDKNDNILKKIDALGNETKYEYDNLDRLKKVTNPKGDFKSYKYDVLSRIIEETDFEGDVTRYAYDALGNKIQQVDAKGNITNYQYDAKNNLTREISALGYQTTYFYDAMDNLVSLENPQGAQSRYAYDNTGNLVSQINFAGEQTTYTYDGNSNVISQKDMLGNTTVFNYDSKNNLAYIQDPKGGVTRYKYDLNSNKSKEIDALGFQTTYLYDKEGNLTQMTGPDNNNISYQYDTLGRKIAEIDQLGNKTTFSYDKLSRLVKQTDSRGYETKYEYDKLGNLTKETNHIGNSISYEYDKNSQIVKLINRRGYKSEYVYDAIGNLSKYIDNHDKEKTFSYDALSRLKQESDFMGNITSYEYDKLGNLTKSTDPAGNATIYAYDLESRLTKTQKPLDVVETKEYDPVGRIAKEIDANGKITSYSYDANSNLTSIVDPLGNITRYDYDLLGRKTQETNALGNFKKLEYDELGRIKKLTNENGYSTTYAYTAKSEIAQITDAKGQTSKFEYNNNSNITSFVDNRGYKTSYGYDGIYQKIYEVLPDDTKISFRYDENGNFAEKIDGRGNSTKYKYDSLDNLMIIIDAAGKETKYYHDENSNRIKERNFAGIETNYSYDNLNRLKEVQDAKGGKYKYEHDPLGRISKEINQNGNETQKAYDKLNNITQIVDALGNASTYEYDANSNLIKEIDALSRTTSYSYDPLDRLVEKKDARGNSKNYSYDKIGNVVSEVDENLHQRSYLYDALGNKVKEVDPQGNFKTFSYDANSNLVKLVDENGHSTNFEYDSKNRLAKKILAGGETYSYNYDPADNLIKETSPKGTSTSYEYDSRNNLVAKIDPLANKQRYSYDALSRLTSATNPEGKQIKYSYDELSRLTEVVDEINASTKYEYDAVGSLVKEINALNNETTYDYDKLSRQTKETNPLGSSWEYTYDAVGNLVKTKDANGNEILNSYDSLNRIVTQNAQRTSQNFVYDNVGNLVEAVNANTRDNYDYDANDRLIAQTSSRSTGEVFEDTFDYDKAGNRTQIEFSDGRIASYGYNANNKLDNLQLKYTGDIVAKDTPQTLETYFIYDDNLNLSYQVNPNKTFTKWSYDNADRLIEVINARGGNMAGSTDSFGGFENYEVFASYNYELNKNGDKVKETILNQVDEYNDEDDFSSEITKLVKEYAYDDARRITSMSLYKGDERTLQTKENYSYDNVGNRTKLEIAGVSSTSYTYNKANQLIEDSSSNYTYDNNGNRTQIMAKSGGDYTKYIYNSFDQVQSVESKKGNEPVYEIGYGYDSLDRRISKVNNTVYDPADTSSNYHGIKTINYDYDGQSLESLSEYFTRKSDFELHTNFYKASGIYPMQPVGVVASEIVANRDAIEFGLPVSTNNVIPRKIVSNENIENVSLSPSKTVPNESENKTIDATPIIPGLDKINQIVNFHHYDGLGSTVATSSWTIGYNIEDGVINPTPEVKLPAVYQINQYSTFGEKTTLNYPGSQYKVGELPSPYSLANWNSITYSTKEIDTETGEYHYGSRNYNPGIASWNQQDSYRGETNDPTTRHRYMFVNDNPLNSVDEYGYGIGLGIKELFTKKSTKEADRLAQIEETRSVERSVNERIALENEINAQNNQLSKIDTYLTNSQNEYNDLSNSINTLSANVQSAKRNAFRAKMDMYDYVLMNNVINRLGVRGYDMNYDDVYSYLNSKTVEKSAIFQRKQLQYISAVRKYSSALNRMNTLADNINLMVADYNGLLDSQNSRFHSLEKVNGEIDGKLDMMHKEHEKRQIKMASYDKIATSVAKIGGAMVIASVCTGLTGGAGAVPCFAAMLPSVINESVNLTGSVYEAQNGKTMNIKAEGLIAIGVEKETAYKISNTIDTVSDVALVTIGVIVTGGAAVAIMASPAGAIIATQGAAIGGKLMTMSIASYGVGAGLEYCSRGDADCGASEYTQIAEGAAIAVISGIDATNTIHQAAQKLSVNTQEVRTEVITDKLRNLNGKTIITKNGSIKIPSNWTFEESDTIGGYVYRNPENPKYDYIRVSPGNPNSLYSDSQGAYIRIFKDEYRDEFGNSVGRTDAAGHIPIIDIK